MLKTISVFILLVCLFINNQVLAEKVDLVVFSFDRPLQLYATLESIEKYVSSIGSIDVIYRASNDEFLKAYKNVSNDFRSFSFHKQEKKEAFKFLLIEFAFFKSSNNYIMFAADDIIVKDTIDLSVCVDFLKETGAYGFHLRLGMNINECYTLNMQVSVPQYSVVADNVYAINYKNGKGDWASPNNVDMTIYKKDEIKYDILKMDFIDPNSFEDSWNSTVNFNKQGLVFKDSKVINVPLNVVNESSIKNRSMDLFSTKSLLSLFNNGLKIDISKFHRINNTAPHVETSVDFIIRKTQT